VEIYDRLDEDEVLVVHLAEGVDETSRKEFDILKDKGLLRAETAIIHGTAFGDAEFKQMGAIGAKLIWSPQSNLALYAKTTNIPLARQHGVEVSLGVGWNASGSDTVFDELRVAQQVNEEQWQGVIPVGQGDRFTNFFYGGALARDGTSREPAAGDHVQLPFTREPRACSPASDAVTDGRGTNGQEASRAATETYPSVNKGASGPRYYGEASQSKGASFPLRTIVIPKIGGLVTGTRCEMGESVLTRATEL
jgi:hypothetical protein